MDLSQAQTTYDYYDVLMSNDLFESFDKERHRYIVNHKIGNGFAEVLTLSEGVEMVFTEMYFDKEIYYECEMPCKFFEFLYCIEGDFSYGDSASNQIVEIHSGETFFWSSGLGKAWIRYKKGVQYNFVAIIYKEGFFDGVTDKADEIREIMFSNTQHSKTGYISASELIIDFHQIEYYRRQEDSLHRYLYLYSKAYEMAALFIEEEKKMRIAEEDKAIFSSDELNKLKIAKALVETNIENPYSIQALSKLVGLNTFKLKNGFKKLYGNTIFGHLRDCRMQKARECLSCTTCTVLEVANIVGYSNPSHFSVAFKKKYGINPSELKNGVVKIPSRVESCSQ